MKINVIKGDITTVKADAIVNAANSSLLGGGGVDGAIHRKGGPQILEDCQKIRNAQGKCKTGNAVITRAGELNVQFVIHTVGPVYNGGKRLEKEEQALRSCYDNSLRLAVENGCTTIAFPCISAGIYRFPKQRAAEIAVETVSNFEDQVVIQELSFVCFDDETSTIYNKLCQKE
ncbi:MAG: O-acetyl-ADP-ribose deacetylase (regulator of RNase III) [Crocinitomicaceae bacterium]|jgi:O-acetyl-ADP-ribose deacetylase (regulator of RNase III)